MKKQNKKGFTIVELVIVIAVIAILAAVLIPTFSNIIKKANQSSDIQACRNINTAISIEMAADDVNTCHDAILAATSIGYALDKFEPKSEGFHFIWNQETKLFALLNDENEVIFGEISSDNTKNWILSEKYDETVPYQIYLKNGYEGVSVDATKGIDVGYNEYLNVNYSGAQANVTIRTNKGILKIDSTTGIINHYGEADTLNIVQCDTASYHEFGVINSELTLKKGHFVLEKTGVIPTIVITATSANDVIVDNKKADSLYIYSADAEIKNSIAVSGSVEKTAKLGKILFAGNYYDTLDEILSDCTSGQTVKLISNLIYDDNDQIIIEKNMNLVIDLNGHSIIGKDDKGSNFAFINIYGSLTVTDSSSSVGSIEYASSTPDPSWGYGTNTISVLTGTLNVKNGIVKNNTSNGASYTVDIGGNSGSGTGDAVFNFSGGELYCDNGDQAVRLCCNNANSAVFNMTGGTIQSGGFWLQQSGDTSKKSFVNISGGTVNGMVDLTCLNANEQKVNISGNAVINVTKLRIRTYSNSRLLSDNSNAAQTTDNFVTIDCSSFTCESLDTSSRGISDESILKKLITVSSTTTVSDNLAFLK